LIEDRGQGFHEDLAAYALGALDPERRREIEARLEGDPELQAELEELQEAAASLALLAPTEEPPRGLKAKLMHRFELELEARKTERKPLPVIRPSGWQRLKRKVLSPRLAYAAPAMITVAAAASLLSVFVFNRMVDRRVGEIQVQMTGQATSVAPSPEASLAKAQPPETKPEVEPDDEAASRIEEAKVEADLKIESKLAVALAELESLKQTVSDQAKLLQFFNREGTALTWMVGDAETRDATAVLATNRPGEPAVLWVNGLPPAPEGKQYQLWLYYQGRIWSPGTFEVRANGTALIPLHLPLAVTNPIYAAVTIEPWGGSSSPTGPNVLTPRR
jgi:anti-sigma-K factor RskA